MKKTFDLIAFDQSIETHEPGYFEEQHKKFHPGGRIPFNPKNFIIVETLRGYYRIRRSDATNERVLHFLEIEDRKPTCPVKNYSERCFFGHHREK